MIESPWRKIGHASELVLADGVFFGVCLLMLSVFHPVIEFLPLDDYQKDAIGRLHYHSLCACMAVAGAGLVLHVISHLTGGGRRS